MKEKNQRLYQNLKPYIIVSFRSMKRLPATKPILKITESNTETERERERETIMVERPEDLVVVVVVVEQSYHAQSVNRVSQVHLQFVSTRLQCSSSRKTLHSRSRDRCRKEPRLLRP